MRKDFAKECSGCCWMKKSGELYFVCVFIECPFHPQDIGHSEQRENGNGAIASDFVS
jgi:hypothetical protein